MILRCQAPNCMNLATHRRKFLDPRRSHDVVSEYVSKNYCSLECEIAICDELERQSNYARIVN